MQGQFKQFHASVIRPRQHLTDTEYYDLYPGHPDLPIRHIAWVLYLDLMKQHIHNNAHRFSQDGHNCGGLSGSKIWPDIPPMPPTAAIFDEDVTKWVQKYSGLKVRGELPMRTRVHP